MKNQTIIIKIKRKYIAVIIENDKVKEVQSEFKGLTWRIL